MKVLLDDLEVRGISTGGIETCLEVPRWKLTFDLGRCAGTTIGCETVLFTHAHADHMGAVGSHVARRALRRAPPPRYVVPRENEDDFNAMLDAWRRLDCSDLPCTVEAAGPGSEVRVRKELVALVFRAPHRVPCQGYHLFSERNKLRDELIGTSSDDIQARKAAGEEVTRVERWSELAFCGDTRFDVIEQEEHLRSARRLMLECTFLDERVSVEQAREMGHVHLDEIVAGAALLEGVGTLLLTHLSARYRPGEAEAIVRAKLPPDLLARTQLFLPQKGG